MQDNKSSITRLFALVKSLSDVLDGLANDEAVIFLPLSLRYSLAELDE